MTDLEGLSFANVDPDLLLSDEELEALTDEEFDRYLKMLQQDAAEWKLTPKQQRAEDLSTEVDELFYGGAAGGGKTDWMLWHAYNQCLEYPGLRILAMRRTYPQLRESLIERSMQKFDSTKCKYGVAEKRWRFTNGSEIKFGFCDTDDDVRHYLSAEYDVVIFEELTEFTEYQYTMLVSRNRTTVKKRRLGIRPHVISASNPGQVGHTWVKERFVVPTEYGRQTSRVEQRVLAPDGTMLTRERRIGFVPAGAFDNPHIDPDYLFNLSSLPEKLRQQYLLGNWDTFDGQFFTEWDRGVHIIEPFVIPEHWPRIRGIDYGFSAPYCCLWGAFDNDGNCYIYREDYGPGHTASEQARRVVDESKMRKDGRIVPERFDYTVADPSVFSTTGSGLSIAQMYRQQGLIVKRGMNARIDGWNRVRDYLRAKPDDPRSGPYVRVMTTCPNLIRTIPQLVFDKNKTEDCDTTGEDHAPDALRYLLMSRPRKAVNKPPKDDTVRAGSRVKEVLRRKQRGPAHDILG